MANRNGGAQTFYGQPLRVHWDGFEGNTHELAKYGWEVEAHEDMRSMCMVLALRHREYQCVCWNQFPYRYDRARYDFDYVPELRVQLHIGKEVHVHGRELPRTYPVDPYPSPRDIACGSQPVSEYMHFRPRDAVHVLADPSVDDLLSQILAKQQPAKDEYFAEQVRQGKLVRASQAEIIQFARAA